MAVFIGTFENKVDRKGRVSVPAVFRQVLGNQSFNGIVAYPSHRNPAVEACGMDFMEQLNGSVSSFELFSTEHNDLTFTLFGDAQQLPFDGEGRIILPPDFVEHANITERAAFIGTGKFFQIWEPGALAAYKREARERLRAQGLTLPMPGGSVAGGGSAAGGVQ